MVEVGKMVEGSFKYVVRSPWSDMPFGGDLEKIAEEELKPFGEGAKVVDVFLDGVLHRAEKPK